MWLSARTAAVIAVLGFAVAILPFPVWLSLVIANGALAAIVATDVVRAPKASDLGIRTSQPLVSTAGRTDPVAVEIYNPRSRPVGCSFRSAAPPSLGMRPTIQRGTLVAEGWTRFTGVVDPRRRGYARIGPLTVRTAGPFRLAGRQRRVDELATIKVYPPLPGRAHVARRIQRARELQVGTRSSAFRGGGEEFDSLRDYHPDDEFRRIDWAATARTGKPISRVYREERDQQLILLLDAGRTMAGTVGGIPRFELAIDAAFCLAELAVHVGDRVGMLAFGGGRTRMIAPRGGRDQPGRILEQMFDVEPVLEAPDYTRAFATVLARHRRRALLILFTELTDAGAMDPLFRSIRSLRTRHLVVLAAVEDPEVAAIAARTPGDAEGAYAKAAAAESLAMRDAAATGLRAMGVAVEDRLPGELATAVADRYLDIKSSGRL
jgi:uncharacterized protein (DUF58 family)